MTATPDVPPSKGMMMIAAYREARLRQRPVLRTSLHESHAARRAARCQGQAAGETAPVPEAETPAPVPTAGASPEAADPASVFASLVSLAIADQRAETIETPADATPPAEQEPLPDVVAVIPPDEAAPTPPEPAEPVLYDPPLAEIGFGPGMLIRLSQLGLRTTGDLAHADANQLRAALGDISRLVDVEAWIASARMTASAATAPAVTEPAATAPAAWADIAENSEIYA